MVPALVPVEAANNEYTYDASSSVQALAIWDTLSFGNSVNMASKTTWMHIATTFGFSMNTNGQSCSFWLYHNGENVWYFWSVHIAATFSFSMNTNDQSCSFQLYHSGEDVWYFTAWNNIASSLTL